MTTFLRRSSLGGLGVVFDQPEPAFTELVGPTSSGFNWKALLETTQQVLQTVAPPLITTFGPKARQYVPSAFQQYLPMALPEPQPKVVKMQDAPSTIEKVAPYAFGAVAIGVLVAVLGGRRRR